MPALVPFVAAAVVTAVRVGARYLLPRLAQAARARLCLTLRQRAAQLYQASEKPKVEASMEELLGPGVSEGDAMAAFAEQTLDGNLTPDKMDNAFEMTFRLVSDEWATRVMKETGRDFSGYIKSVETDNLRHSHKGHGVGNEQDKSQVPVTIKDYALAPVVIEDFDGVTYKEAKGGRSASLLFKKRFNGTIYVVQYVRGKTQRLTFKSMWIKKAVAK